MTREEANQRVHRACAAAGYPISRRYDHEEACLQDVVRDWYAVTLLVIFHDLFSGAEQTEPGRKVLDRFCRRYRGRGAQHETLERVTLGDLITAVQEAYP